VQTSAGTTATKYALDGWDPALKGSTGNSNWNVWADLTSSNTIQTRYLWGDQVNELFARIGSTGTAAFLLTDHLDSIVGVTNASGALQDVITYDAYGNFTESNSGMLGSYTYAGMEFDSTTQLYYSRARYYDATTGRWISQDPLGFNAGDSNLYRYVLNQPTYWTDPSGLDDHHWFPQYGQGGDDTRWGNKYVWSRFPDLQKWGFNIDQFTTTYPGGTASIHGWIHNQHKYSDQYWTILTTSCNSCEFLKKVVALMAKTVTAIQIAFPQSKCSFTLHGYKVKDRTEWALQYYIDRVCKQKQVEEKKVKVKNRQWNWYDAFNLILVGEGVRQIFWKFLPEPVPAPVPGPAPVPVRWFNPAAGLWWLIPMNSLDPWWDPEGIFKGYGQGGIGA
jgi:RHS repeat-associated protein